MSYLKLGKDEGAYWRKTTDPGFGQGGYWCLMRSRPHVVGGGNQLTAKKHKRNRWETRYAQRNAARHRTKAW